MVLSCLVCKDTFYTKPARIKTGRGKYCSKECFYFTRKGIPLKNIDYANRPSGSKGKPNTWSKPPVMFGEENHEWKGEKVGYFSLHKWIRRQLGNPLFCSNDKNHAAPIFHWSNISGEYKRDLNDWHSLCPSCNKTDGVRKNKRFL